MVWGGGKLSLTPLKRRGGNNFSHAEKRGPLKVLGSLNRGA